MLVSYSLFGHVHIDMKKKKYIHLGGSSNPVGYCTYHKATLSVNQLKSKECLQKKCRRLIKYNHEYWNQLEQKKQAKQKLKEKKKKEEKMEKEKELRSDIVKRATYCHNAPVKYKDQLDYCSQCPYGEKCLTELVELVYDYFNRF